ncbi:MAG: PEP-CTERM sorting domain-containing protein [Planctomycetota bacterium]|nr:PEP-CTERM sorting domain-containing protein [Planctomycetota bacterium]
MNLNWKNAGLLLLGGLIMCARSQAAQAVVIFEDNYTTRLAAGNIAGSAPNITNTGGAQYGLNVDPGGSATAKIENTGIGQALAFFSDNGVSSVYLPYAKNMVGSTDVLRLTLTFRKPTGTPLQFNNFIMGFAGTTPGSGISEWFLFDNAGRVETWVPGTTTFGIGAQRTRLDVVLPATPASYSSAVAPVVAQNLNTFVMEYDPTKFTGNPTTDNPWSLTFNGEKASVRKAAVTVFNPLTAIGGIAFGNINADGGFDRNVWLTGMKFEVVPEPSSIALFGLGAAGMAFVVARRRRVAR